MFQVKCITKLFKTSRSYIYILRDRRKNANNVRKSIYCNLLHTKWKCIVSQMCVYFGKFIFWISLLLLYVFLILLCSYFTQCLFCHWLEETSVQSCTISSSSVFFSPHWFGQRALYALTLSYLYFSKPIRYANCNHVCLTYISNFSIIARDIVFNK